MQGNRFVPGFSYCEIGNPSNPSAASCVGDSTPEKDGGMITRYSDYAFPSATTASPSPATSPLHAGGHGRGPSGSVDGDLHSTHRFYGKGNRAARRVLSDGPDGE